MAVTLTLTRVDRPVAGGLLVVFDDSNSLSFDTVAAMSDYAEGPAQDDRDFCHRTLLRYWLARDPSGVNDNAIEGRTCAFDVTQNRAVVEVY